jgi:hypothetical protein
VTLEASFANRNRYLPVRTYQKSMNSDGQHQVEPREMDESSLPAYLKALTYVQIQAFKAFKALCEKNDLGWPRSELQDGSQRGLNDDYTLLYVHELGSENLTS